MWVLEQIKAKLILQAKITDMIYFGYIMRSQDSLEKTVIMGKVEGSQKRESPHTRWIDSIKEAKGLSLLYKNIFGDCLFTGST